MDHTSNSPACALFQLNHIVWDKWVCINTTIQPMSSTSMVHTSYPATWATWLSFHTNACTFFQSKSVIYYQITKNCMAWTAHITYQIWKRHCKRNNRCYDLDSMEPCISWIYGLYELFQDISSDTLCENILISQIILKHLKGQGGVVLHGIPEGNKYKSIFYCIEEHTVR